MKTLFYSAALFLIVFGEIRKVSAQHNTIVSFTGFDGALPGGTPHVDQNLISDGAFLYGMTSGGGTSGIGVIFKVMSDGTGYTKLLDFLGATNGSRPNGSLLAIGPFLYSMKREGGANNMGTLFKVSSDGTHTNLWNFTGFASFPTSSLFLNGSSYSE